MFALSPAVLAAFAALSVTVPVDLDALPDGPPPAISWYSYGVLHTGESEYSLGDRALAGFARVEDGYVVHAWNDGSDDELFLVDGTTERVLATAPGDGTEIFGPVVSADGSRIAWSVGYALGGLNASATRDRRTELVVADADTGETLYSKDVSGDDLRARGFAGESVLLDRGTETGVLRWRPDTGELTEWDDASELTAVSESAGLAAVVDAERPSCAGVRATNDDAHEQLWQVCGATVIGFDPSGTYAVTRADVDDDTVLIGVRDAMTGTRVLRLRTGGGTPEVAWEPTGRLLVTAWDEGRNGMRMGIVRCTAPDGTCELAKPARSTSTGWPYVLPIQ